MNRFTFERTGSARVMFSISSAVAEEEFRKLTSKMFSAEMDTESGFVVCRCLLKESACPISLPEVFLNV